MLAFFRCYIGSRHLQEAIKSLAKDASFEISWVPFLLDAHTIPEGIPLNVYLANKFGEKVAKQEMKGNGPTSKAGKSVVSAFFALYLTVGMIGFAKCQSTSLK